MQILQITDPHLYGSADGQAARRGDRFEPARVLDDAFAAVPDYAAMLVTGDLVQDDPAGYLRFRSIFGESHAARAVHPRQSRRAGGDARANSRTRRSRSAARSRRARWQFIMLDSYDPGQVGGRLAAAELARLDAALAVPTHTMVCLHHHPIAMGSRWLDGIGLANADEFWRIVDAHRTCARSSGATFIRPTRAPAAGCACSRPPRPARSFCPAATLRGRRQPARVAQFDLHADGRIDSMVHWVEPLSVRQAAAAR